MTLNSSTDPLSAVAETAILTNIRTGSPFAMNSSAPSLGMGRRDALPAVDRESIGEGVWRETAAAAAYASWMLIVFATVGWVWFPVGGIAIAILGVAMSVIGLSSKHVKLSVTSIAIQVMILIACYLQTM